MIFNEGTIKSVFEQLKSDLGQGFVASEIWALAEGEPLFKEHGYNSNPRIAPLFNEVTRKLYKVLKESEYPNLGNYYLVNLENNHLVVLLAIAKYQLFVLVDLTKTPMGVLMNVALPNLLDNLTVEAGVKSFEELENTETLQTEGNLSEKSETELTGWALYKQIRDPGVSFKSEKPREKFSLREAFSALLGIEEQSDENER